MKKDQKNKLPNLQEQENAMDKFCSPVPNKSKQHVRVNGKYDKQTKKPIPQFEQTYEVSDQMTIAQLRNLWYEKNIKDVQGLSQNFKQENYVVMYDDQFPLYDYYTISQFKKKLGVQTLGKNILIRIYYEWDCQYFQNQSAVKYENYEQKHHQQVQTPIKLIVSPTKSYYFYVQTILLTTILNLIEQIKLHLKSSNQIEIKSLNYQYCLTMKSKYLQKEDKQKIAQNYGIQKNVLEDVTIDITKLIEKGNQKIKEIKLRELCPPGEVLELRILNSEVVYKNLQNQQEIKNPQIHITYYEKVNLKSTVSPVLQKQIIKKYSQIKDLKVSTLLLQYQIHDALFTSVSYKNLVVKPLQKFSKFDSIISQSTQKQLKFTTVPQNLLYYKQLISLQDTIAQDYSIDQLLQTSLQDQQHRKKIRTKIQEIANKVQVQQQLKEFKDNFFIDPILMFTSPFIYRKLNPFLRQSSMSLIDTEKIVQDRNQWHYPFCEKLIKSLLKLPNFQGTTYRGSVNYKYNFQPGQIIEWNSFTSTSQDLLVALKFISKQNSDTFTLPCLFEIQTYSGKSIDKFSYFKDQKQVVIFPYTKFKVIEKLNIHKLEDRLPMQHYRLLEIPVPKKIPGHIVVWIDKNINENFKAFMRIISALQRQDFDLIQLVSNDHFQIWLDQFKQILSLPQVKVHFISNLNRPPYFKQQGIQTLRIIRDFNKTATVVYYIGNIEVTKDHLKNYWQKNNLPQDPNVKVVRTIHALRQIFDEDFCQQ